MKVAPYSISNLQKDFTRIFSIFTFILLLSACATQPREVFYGATPPETTDSTLATVELKDASWAKFNDMHVDGKKYSSAKLPPGTYEVTYKVTFMVSFMVDPRMMVSREISTRATFEPGRTYRLRAARTYGPGYMTYFWIEDDLGNLTAGTYFM